MAAEDATPAMSATRRAPTPMSTGANRSAKPPRSLWSPAITFLLACAHAVFIVLLAEPDALSLLPALGLLVPLALLAERTGAPLRASAAVWLTASIAWGFAHAWIGGISFLGLPLLAAVMGLFSAIPLLLATRLRSRWSVSPLLSLPALWAGLEFFRGEILFTGYAWFLLGNESIPLVERTAGTLDQYGRSFALAVAAMASLAMLTRIARRARKERVRGKGVEAQLAVLLALVAWWGSGFVGFGQREPVETQAEPLRAAMIQSAVSQEVRTNWNIDQRLEEFGRILRLTALAYDTFPELDVIVWPETMFAGGSLDTQAVAEERAAALAFRTSTGELVPSTLFYDALMQMSAERTPGVDLLIGAIGFESLRIELEEDGSADLTWDRKHNSLFTLRDGAVRARADKRRLAPFGEVLPYVDAWPWLRERVLAAAANGMPFDLDPGAPAPAPGTIAARDGRRVRFATTICFEVAADDVHRASLLAPDPAGENGRGAELIVNVSNDGWFGGSVRAHLNHLHLARVRSAERRTPTLRAANTGICAAIDASGAVLGTTFLSEEGRVTEQHDLPPGGIGVWGVRYAELLIPTPASAVPTMLNSGWVFFASALLGAALAFVPRKLPPDERPSDADRA